MADPTPTPDPTPAAPAPTPGDTLYPAEPAAPATPDPAPVDPAPEPSPDPAPPPDPAPDPAALELKLPEGVELDAAVMDTFKQTLVDPALSQNERGQKLVDMFVDLQTKAATEQQKAWETTQEGWLKDIQTDPVMGKDFAQTTEILGKALDAFGTKEAREAFEITGAGNNPHVVRFVYNMAKALNEGTHVQPGNVAPKGPRTAGAILYGDGPASQ